MNIGHEHNLCANMRTSQVQNCRLTKKANLHIKLSMDDITKLHSEYLQKILHECHVRSLTALAKTIKVSPSTLNRFGKKGGQETLSAHTLSKLHEFSGIAPPATKTAIDLNILCKAIEEGLQAAPEKLSLEDKAAIINNRYIRLSEEAEKKTQIEPMQKVDNL